MRQVDLLTRVGTYVVTVQVPAFNPIPEVLVWGDRVFVRRVDDRYYEGMAWAVCARKRVWKCCG